MDESESLNNSRFKITTISDKKERQKTSGGMLPEQKERVILVSTARPEHLENDELIQACYDAVKSYNARRAR